MWTTESSVRNITELTHLSKSLLVDGVPVRARCYAVERGRHARYEIVLDGPGASAVVDVVSERELRPYLDYALAAFAASHRVVAGARR